VQTDGEVLRNFSAPPDRSDAQAKSTAATSGTRQASSPRKSRRPQAASPRPAPPSTADRLRNIAPTRTAAPRCRARAAATALQAPAPRVHVPDASAPPWRGRAMRSRPRPQGRRSPTASMRHQPRVTLAWVVTGPATVCARTMDDAPARSWAARRRAASIPNNAAASRLKSIPATGQYLATRSVW